MLEAEARNAYTEGVRIEDFPFSENFGIFVLK